MSEVAVWETNGSGMFWRSTQLSLDGPTSLCSKTWQPIPDPLLLDQNSGCLHQHIRSCQMDEIHSTVNSASIPCNSDKPLLRSTLVQPGHPKPCIHAQGFILSEKVRGAGPAAWDPKVPKLQPRILAERKTM